MNDKRKSIMRHEALRPLSRHHMNALHLALKLSRAGTEKSRLSLKEIKNELNEFWEPGGQEHFREEEEIVLPTFALHASIDRPEIIEMLMEHVQIRFLIQHILTTQNIDEKQMQKLGSLLELHVRKEERIIFPMIEAALPEKVLLEMAPYLHE